MTSSTSSSSLPSTTAVGITRSPLAGRLIVIDPGHNGANRNHPKEINRLVDAGGFRKACNTVGTSASGYSEALFNWEVSLQTKQLLAERGAVVVLTRQSNDGWGPCVDSRGLTATRAGADLMVSFHADGAAPAARGFHVISASASTSVPADLAARSSLLADHLRDALVRSGFTPSTYVGNEGRVTRRDLGTLNRSASPSAMIECGNMHNKSDLALLRSIDGQRRLAEAVVTGIETYLKSTAPS